MNTSLIVVALALLSGCASLKPDYLHVAETHVSQPMLGQGPFPIGGKLLPETTYEALEVGATWTKGRAFAETSMGYAWHSTNLDGDHWIFTAKGGLRWGLDK